MRIGLSQILWVVNGLLVPARQCQALAPSASPLGNSLAQFLHQAEASPCLVARRAAADLALGNSFSSCFWQRTLQSLFMISVAVLRLMLSSVLY